jgi:hypothetical protein
MKSKKAKSSASGTYSITLGRKRYAKIAAVEGLRLSPEMERTFARFDREGLSPAERRAYVLKQFKRHIRS